MGRPLVATTSSGSSARSSRSSSARTARRAPTPPSSSLVDYDPLPAVLVDPAEALEGRGAALPRGRDERRRPAPSPTRRTTRACSTAATSSSRTRSSASGWRRARSSRARRPPSSATTGASPPGSRRRRRTRTGWASPACSGSTRARSASSPRTSAAASARRCRARGDRARRWLARKLGRPVRWTETRSESMVGAPPRPGAAARVHARRDPRREAARLPARACSRTPAPTRSLGAFLPNLTALMASGVYAIPKIEVEGRSVVTNTTPTSRPSAAPGGRRRRRRSSARSTCSPPRSGSTRPRSGGRTSSRRTRSRTRPPSGATYDSGDYEGALDLALRSAGYEELRAEQRRRRASRADTRSSGIGLCAYVEITNPLGEAEFGEVEITADGGAIVRTGSFSHGQGHETTFAMIAAERLGIPLEKVSVVKGDTDDVAAGDRHVRLEVDADRRRRRPARRRRGRRAARRSSSPTTSRRARTTSCSTTRSGRFHVAGTPEPALSWAELADARRRRRAARAS